MPTSAPSLSPFSTPQVDLCRTPQVAREAATVPEKPSPIVAPTPQAHSSLDSAHALIVRYTVVVIGWALLGIYCAEVFSAFRSH
jgi:hypothetical protein